MQVFAHVNRRLLLRLLMGLDAANQGDTLTQLRHDVVAHTGFKAMDLGLDMDNLGLLNSGAKSHHSVGRFDGASNKLQPFTVCNALGRHKDHVLKPTVLLPGIAVKPGR